MTGLPARRVTSIACRRCPRLTRPLGAYSWLEGRGTVDAEEYFCLSVRHGRARRVHGAPGFHPAPVLAASGTLSTDTPLHDSPDPAAPVIALLRAGTSVSIDGPPVEGFYPVTAGDLAGWMRGETLQLEKDTPAPAATEDTDAAPPVDDTDPTIRVEATAAAEVAAEPTIDPTVTSLSVPEIAAVGLAGVVVDGLFSLGPGPTTGSSLQPPREARWTNRPCDQRVRHGAVR